MLSACRNVTTIIKDLNPRVEKYLNQLLQSSSIQVNQVHEGSMYEPMVSETKAWTCIGVFYDYLIRKELYNLLGLEAFDTRASIFEKQVISYNKFINKCSSNEENLSVSLSSDDDSDDEWMYDSLFEEEEIKPLLVPVTSYLKYKDPNNATLDIIEDIFNTSMLHRHFFRDAMRPFNPKLLNYENIKTVLKFVQTWSKNNISLNPAVGGKYFCGDADLILDDLLFDIKVSMYPLNFARVQSKRNFYQLMIYALGVFINEGKEIKKFKLYNPLLGLEYYLETPSLDFNEFLKLVDEVAPL